MKRKGRKQLWKKRGLQFVRYGVSYCWELKSTVQIHGRTLLPNEDDLQSSSSSQGSLIPRGPFPNQCGGALLHMCSNTILQFVCAQRVGSSGSSLSHQCIPGHNSARDRVDFWDLFFFLHVYAHSYQKVSTFWLEFTQCHIFVKGWTILLKEEIEDTMRACAGSRPGCCSTVAEHFLPKVGVGKKKADISLCCVSSPMLVGVLRYCKQFL